MTPRESEFAFLALHRYWMWANRMREHFDKAIMDPASQERAKNAAEDPRAYMLRFICDDPGIFMSYWYGGLHVVVEGWKELGLNDPVIDAMIQDPKAGLLKRYRNGAFHFQKDYFDQRFRGFMEEGDSAVWVRSLTKEFGRYFLDKVRSK